MFDAVRVLGSAVRHVYQRDGESLARAGLDFNVSMIFGGQIRGEGMRLFQVYSAGNFIEATTETPFFQIGESKYGKPVLDRVITPDNPAGRGGQVRAGVDGLHAQVQPLGGPAAGPGGVRGRPAWPLTASPASTSTTPTCACCARTWGQKLREVFDSIEHPTWDGTPTTVPLMGGSERNQSLRKITNEREKLI